MKTTSLVAPAALLCMFISAPALADCTTSDFTFLFSNDTVHAVSTSDAAGCTYEYSVDGDVHLAKASIVGKPQHGQLKQTTRFTFEYVPTKGFRGTDKYSVKVCSSDGGCSTIAYQATVQ